MDSYTLNFPVVAGDPGPLRSIAAAADQIAQRTNVSAAQFKNWKTVVDTAVESGYSLNKALDIAAKTFDKSGIAMGAFTSRIKEHVTEQKRLETQAQATERSLSRMAAQMVSRSTGIPGIPGGAAGSSLLSALPGGAGALLGVGAITAGTAALLGWSKAQADAAREIANLAEKTGLTIRETQLWSKSAEVAGVNAGALVAGMRSLSRGLADGGEEGKRQREVLDQLGIKYEDTLHRLLPVGQIIEQIGAKFATMAAGPARDLMANTLFGRGGLELLPLITRMKELGVQVDATGVIMSNAANKQFREAAEAISLIEQRWEALKRSMAEPLIATILFAGGRRSLTDPINPDNNDSNPYLPFGLGPKENPLARLGLTGKSTRGAPTAADADVLKGNLLYNQFVNRRSDTDKRDLQVQLEEAKQKLANTPKPQAGIPADQQKATIQAYEANEKTVRSIQDRIAANDKLKQQQESMASFSERMLEKDTDPITRIFAERDALIKKQVLNSRQAGDVSGDALVGASKELAKEQKKLDDENEKHRLAVIQAKDERELDLRKRLAAGDEDEIATIYKRQQVQDQASREIEKIGLNTRREAIIRQADFEQSQVGSEVGTIGQGRISLRPRWVRGTQTPSSDTNVVPRGSVRGGPQSSVNDAFENRLSLAKQLYDMDKAAAAEQFNDDEKALGRDQAVANQRKANALALKDLETQTADAVLEREKQILKIQEEQRAQYENLAKGAFSALVQGGHRGLTEFVKQQFLGSASTVVGNLAGLAYDQVGGGLLQIPGQTNPDGSKNILGKMLGKTAFGIDPLKAAQSLNIQPLTDALTKGSGSTDALKMSVDTLNNTIAFLVSGGTVGSLPGGLTTLPASGTPAALTALGMGIPGLPGSASSLASTFPFLGPTSNAFAASVAPALASGVSDALNSLPLAAPVGYGLGDASPGIDINSLPMTSPSIPMDFAYSDGALPSSASAAVNAAQQALASVPALRGGAAAMTDSQLAASGLGLLKTAGTISQGFGDFSVPIMPGVAVSGSSLISSGAQLGMSALGIVNGLNTGGVRGGLQVAGGAVGAVGGLASLAGTLGMLSPALGPLAPIAGGVAAALGLASALFGDPKQERMNAINKTLENQQFYSPVAINTNQSIYGGATAYNRYGDLTTTNLSPYPQIQEPYYLFQQHQLVPGRTTNYYGGSGPGQPAVSPGTGSGGSSAPGTTVNIIQAMDSESFGDFIKKPSNAQHVGDAHALALDTGGNNALEAIRRSLGIN